MNRSLARENAFILIFEAVSKPDESAEEIFEKVTESREFEINDYVRNAFFGVTEKAGDLDAVIEKNLVGWNAKRVSSVSKAILKLAAYEMLYVDDVPTKVAINEAVELSKKYDDEKVYSFINGVLNHLAESEGLK